MEGKSAEYRDFVSSISCTVDKKRIYTDPLRCLAWGTDAGFYRLIPQVVVRVADENEVALVLKEASHLKLPLTFRAAGTSLSGQAISDSILIVAGKEWENYRLLDDKAHAIAIQPGITGARVDEILAPYGRLFSPDPASKKSAMVGGIVANNASGMKCGTHANSDRILLSLRIVLADGTILDTADEASRQEFNRTHGHILEELATIRDEIRRNTALTERIRRKYSIKNVTGLNLLPFILYDDPYDILIHCMAGSEGTLAFLSEIRMATAPRHPFSASAMVYFDDLAEACRAVVALKNDAHIQACELLDCKSLASVGDNTGDGLTALLLQTEADSKILLQKNIDATTDVLKSFRLFKEAHFSTDPEEVAAWWQMRSGIFPAVGGTRPAGTTALIEDIAFHIDDLPTASVELRQILTDCGYDDACIYGHALEGNYHFIIAQSFNTPQEVEKYKRLMMRIEELVVDRYDGSLKAEHGTGRNMAPFVESEWGTDAWGYMKRIKRIFDPENLLNPGVIFNNDPDCFVHNMKPLPLTDPAVDRCIECGFCEVNCVSCGLTLSARQRIVAAREMSRLSRDGSNPGRLRALQHEFVYYGRETCAGDGLCSTSCPMKINTADLIHSFRQAALPRTSAGYRSGAFAANHLAGISSALRVLLGTAATARSVIGERGVRAAGKTLHSLGLPLWTPALPGSFSPKRLEKDITAHKVTDKNAEHRVVYIPSCINRTFGATKEKDATPEPLPEVFVRLCRKAGYKVIFPDGMDSLCCGMIWESKGMPDLAEKKIRELETALVKASENGKIPVVCDQSPCLHRMRENIKALKLYEPAEFILDFLAQHLDFSRSDTPVALHITCSTRRMGLAAKITTLASLCSTAVTVPAEVGCCGFAGDKGFTFPELNRWGLRKLREAIKASGAGEGFSNSRTCEIGLTENGGIPYKSIVYLVDRCTTPKTHRT